MTIIYQDESVAITTEVIIIQKFYFLFEDTKNIKFQDIQNITIKEDMCDTLTWGLEINNTQKWFDKEEDRENKPKYIEVQLKRQKCKACFRPDDCKKVLTIIKAQMDAKGIKLASQQLKPLMNRKKLTQTLQQSEKSQSSQQGNIIDVPQLLTNIAQQLFQS